MGLEGFDRRLQNCVSLPKALEIVFAVYVVFSVHAHAEGMIDRVRIVEVVLASWKISEVETLTLPMFVCDCDFCMQGVCREGIVQPIRIRGRSHQGTDLWGVTLAGIAVTLATTSVPEVKSGPMFRSFSSCVEQF